jgi:hypothetical protein
MNNFESRHNVIKYSLLVLQYVRRECFISSFLEWIRTVVTSTDIKTIKLVHSERALRSATYWKWPSGSFLMTPKPFNCSILCAIYNFMDFRNSCCSAVRNKNFEWTALSGISTIIDSYKDVNLLLSVWLILREHRARRANPFRTSSFGTLSRANSFHWQRRARTEFLWFLVPCTLSRKQSP